MNAALSKVFSDFDIKEVMLIFFDETLIIIVNSVVTGFIPTRR